MRIALHSVLREGHEAAYDEAHAAIPAELAASFERLGGGVDDQELPLVWELSQQRDS